MSKWRVCVVLTLLLLGVEGVEHNVLAEPKRGLTPELEPEKHYLRTAIEEAIALSGGTAWYWIDRDRQVADWDFPSWSERLSTSVLRYDNNPFHVNFAWHAGNGAAYHMIGRVNGLSLWQSMGAGLLTSLTWEYALEYREKVSVNDLLFTTGAGIPLGEFLYVLGRFLHEDESASEWSAVRWTAGFPMALTRAIDGDTALSTSPSPLWHSIHVGYELGATAVDVGGSSSSYTLHTLHLDGRFVRIPNYLRPGTLSSGFYSGEFTRASMDFAGTSGGSAVKMWADTTLLGWYWQRVKADPRALSHTAMLGVAVAYRYRREQVLLWDDRVAVFHMPGLSGMASAHWGAFDLVASLRASPDFAGVNSLANEQWNRAHPNESGKAILRKMGYYYGFGASLSAALELRYRFLSLGAAVWAARYRSDEGLDRTQENVTLDQEASDDILDAQVDLQVDGLPGHTYLGLRLESRTRKSVLEEFRVQARFRRLLVQLGVSF